MNSFVKAASHIVLGAILAVTPAMSVSGQANGQAAPNSEFIDQVVARAVQGTEALRQNRTDEAIRLFTEVIATDALPNNILAGAYYHRGVAYQKNARYNDAVSDYTSALWLEALPDNVKARALYNRGSALDNLGELQRAREDLDKAIALDPAFSPAYNNRGNVRRRMGDYTGAIADYDASISLGNPLPHLPYYGRSQARMELGQAEAARADLERSIQLAPNFQLARKALASLDTPSMTSALTASESPLEKAAAPKPVEPVETAFLPPPGQAKAAAPRTVRTADITDAANADRPVAPSTMAPARSAAAAAQEKSAPRFPSLASLPIPEPKPQMAARPQTAATATPEGGGFTTTVIPARPASSGKAMADAGGWTTRVLPAARLADARSTLGIRETAIASDAAPQPAPPEAAAKPAVPKEAEPFKGVPAEPYRTAARTPSKEQATAVRKRPAVAGDYEVQLASFRSEAEANDGRAAMQARLATVLGDNARMRILKADIPGKGTYFRVRVGPMDNRADAKALCGTLKTYGQDCYVARN